MNSIKFILSVILLLNICACGLNSNQNSVTESKYSTSKAAELEDTALHVEIQDDLTTLEGFWAVFKQAVKEQDIDKIESLYAPDALKIKFSDETYQLRIAQSSASDISETPSYGDQEKTYQFMMIFPASSDQEESATSIYLRRNSKGNFEISNVIEAG